MRVLGNTGIEVSRICFGALTIGPLQANLSIKEGARVLQRALSAGINFIDTAKIYGTYPYIREAIKDHKNDVILVSKSYDYTYDGMQESIREALQELGRDYIDIFMLHEQESALTLKGHAEAIEYLTHAKKAGLIRAAGISTHHIAAVLAAADMPEIEVIHPIINISGLGIQDGTAVEMLQAIKTAYNKGKGLYGMKSLGGGNLLSQTDKALNFVLAIDELSSVAIGMRSDAEVSYNVSFFAGSPIAPEIADQLNKISRRLHIEDWCKNCGECVQRCQAGALSIGIDRVQVNQDKCRLCGYCASVCPEFCIKVI
ncbi:aldo/keto reductase [Desulfofarcimen acetoxidans]|jgi:aryl-alcohol dehydrogenase-like predicted oxidoreductase|nr:aldo/keto reductase [Desulfofarcimen acetoxidans]